MCCLKSEDRLPLLKVIRELKRFSESNRPVPNATDGDDAGSDRGLAQPTLSPVNRLGRVTSIVRLPSRISNDAKSSQCAPNDNNQSQHSDVPIFYRGADPVYGECIRLFSIFTDGNANQQEQAWSEHRFPIPQLARALVTNGRFDLLQDAFAIGGEHAKRAAAHFLIEMAKHFPEKVYDKGLLPGLKKLLLPALSKGPRRIPQDVKEMGVTCVRLLLEKAPRENVNMMVDAGFLQMFLSNITSQPDADMLLLLVLFAEKDPRAVEDRISHRHHWGMLVDLERHRDPLIAGRSKEVLETLGRHSSSAKDKIAGWRSYPCQTR